MSSKRWWETTRGQRQPLKGGFANRDFDFRNATLGIMVTGYKLGLINDDNIENLRYARVSDLVRDVLGRAKTYGN